MRAAGIIAGGGLVAFPTETVYGLGANALDDKAVAQIFEVKNRPNFNPLIIHISSISDALRIAEFDDRAEKVANAFWPGPLSIVLPRRVDQKYHSWQRRIRHNRIAYAGQQSGPKASSRSTMSDSCAKRQ